MLKKSTCVCSDSLLPYHLNKPTIKISRELFESQQPLEKRETKANNENNSLHCQRKAANTMSKPICSAKNFMPNNRIRLKPTARRNVMSTESFNANSLGCRNNEDQANNTQLKAAEEYKSDCQRKAKEKQNILKSSSKLMRLQNLQQQQRLKNHSPQTRQHFEKNMKQNSVNQICANSSTPLECNKTYTKYLSCISVTVLPALLTENHCPASWHLLDVENESELLQLICRKQRPDCQSTWLKREPQHKEILCGIFETLPSRLYWKLPALRPCDRIKMCIESNYPNPNHFCFSHFTKTKCVLKESKKFTGFQTLAQNCCCLDCGRALKNLQKKIKPSDHDVIFGHAYQLLSKSYGWEKSRLNWLLKLEQAKLK